MNAATPIRPDLIKLSNERVREMLIESSSRGPLDVWRNAEVAALAQNVLDLRTANGILTSTAEITDDVIAKHVATIESLRAEIDDCNRIIRELTHRCEDYELRDDMRATSVTR